MGFYAGNIKSKMDERGVIGAVFWGFKKVLDFLGFLCYLITNFQLRP